MRNLLNFFRSQKGQATVEAAYLLPIIIGVIYAGMEVANIYNSWRNFKNAARTGAAIISRGGSDLEAKNSVYENIGKTIRLGLVEFNAGQVEVFPDSRDTTSFANGMPCGVRIIYKVGFGIPFLAHQSITADMTVSNIRKINLPGTVYVNYGDAGKLIPILIKAQPFTPGQTYNVRSGGTSSTGNWGAMNFDDEAHAVGNAEYLDWIKNGYPGDPPAVGDDRYTEPGFKPSGTANGLCYRVWDDYTRDGAYDETWSNCPADSARRVVLPVVMDWDSGGTHPEQIIVYAEFFINRVYNVAADGSTTDLAWGDVINPATGAPVPGAGGITEANCEWEFVFMQYNADMGT